MNYTAALPETDFFDEKGLLKEYRPPPMQQQIGSMNDALFQNGPGSKAPNNATSVSDSVPDPVSHLQISHSKNFRSQEVVTQSQTDSSSISDTSDPRETNNSSSKATRSTDLPLKSVQNRASDEEMTEIRDLTVSEKHIQSTRDSSTISISENSTTSNSTPGTYNGIPFEKEGEIQKNTSRN